VAGGEEEDGGGGAGAAEGLDDVEAVAGGEHDVQDEAVVGFLCGPAVCLGAVEGEVDGVAFVAEAVGQRAGEGGVGFGDEKSHGTGPRLDGRTGRSRGTSGRMGVARSVRHSSSGEVVTEPSTRTMLMVCL